MSDFSAATHGRCERRGLGPRTITQGSRTFEAIVERAPDSVALLEADGRITYANLAYCDLTGVPNK